ncbi:MAG TPA: hypothetical protein VM261_28000 [Kofleriaceae bacterium]|nr:hypothetical protein [Kofleriaceae bacterium]
MSSPGCATSFGPPPALRVPPPTAAAPPSGPRQIHPGVLRALMIEGELFATFEGPLPDDVNRTRGLLAYVRVCLDRDGNATSELVASAPSAAFTQAALETVSTWRFRPYVSGGTAQPACALARFHHTSSSADRNPALPDARVELPPAIEQPISVAPGYVGRAPTPGVAFARLCRKPGSRAAPTFALLQSSGDPGFDRALFDERATAPLREPAGGGRHCWLRSGLAFARATTFDFEGHVGGAPIGPRDLEMARVSGDRNVVPGDRLKFEIRDARIALGADVMIIEVPLEVCVDTSGRPFQVKILKTSGYYPYDMDLINAVASWRYRPTDAPVCSIVNFIYRQR